MWRLSTEGGFYFVIFLSFRRNTRITLCSIYKLTAISVSNMNTYPRITALVRTLGKLKGLLAKPSDSGKFKGQLPIPSHLALYVHVRSVTHTEWLALYPKEEMQHTSFISTPEHYSITIFQPKEFSGLSLSGLTCIDLVRSAVASFPLRAVEQWLLSQEQGVAGSLLLLDGFSMAFYHMPGAPRRTKRNKMGSTTTRLDSKARKHGEYPAFALYTYATTDVKRFQTRSYCVGNAHTRYVKSTSFNTKGEQ